MDSDILGGLDKPATTDVHPTSAKTQNNAIGAGLDLTVIDTKPNESIRASPELDVVSVQH
jgi:hypothetical protein